jgi:hypothetical protein
VMSVGVRPAAFDEMRVAVGNRRGGNCQLDMSRFSYVPDHCHFRL